LLKTIEKYSRVLTLLVMGRGQKFLTQVSLGQFYVAQVGSAILGLGLGLENFPLKSQFLKKISLWIKNLIGLGQKLPVSKKG